MKKRLAGLLCLLLVVSASFAQGSTTLDSLLRQLAKAPADSNKVYLLLSIANQYDVAAPDQARQYAAAAVDLSNRLKFAPGQMKSYRYLAYLASYKSRFDSVVLYNRIVLDIARREKDSFNIGAACFNIGSAYRFLYELDSAVDYTLTGARLLEGKGFYAVESTLNDGLQSLYMTLRQFDKAIAYGEKAVAIARKVENSQQLVNALNNLGLVYVDADRIADAKKVYQEGLDIAIRQKNGPLETMLRNNLADLYIQEGAYEQAGENARRSMQLATTLQDEGTLMNAKAIMAGYFLYKSDYPAAERLAKEVVQAAEQQSLDDSKIAGLNLLSKIAFAAGRYQQGFAYDAQKARLEAAVFNESVKQREAAIRIRFETERKDDEIKLQKAEIRRKNTFNAILLASGITLLIITLLGYYSYTQKQKLQQQRINELETEKQLAATAAVLKGEEQERTRLSKDLHDGLGGMLSGIKYALHTMKDNLILTPENARAFERSMDMLDSSIREMRRVAHNMMPEALVKFGLDTALRDFCNDITQSGALKVSYQSVATEDLMLDNTMAITIYRIVQELLNNAIKHAAATSALVQLVKADGALTVTVEDDGKGFDPALLQQVSGIGWDNIRNRVEFLKGKLDLHAQPGSGTSVNIEFKV